MADVLKTGRLAEVRRETNETAVMVRLNLDSPGETRIRTPVPFLDHMLAALARHGRLGLEIEATGDVEIDDHHTVEDIGLVLGEALHRAIGTKAGIARFGCAFAPMDEALARVVLDISGRPYTSWNVQMRSSTVGGMRLFHTDLPEEFFRALVSNARITAHFDLLRATNDHHAIEALFKAFALAVRMAVEQTEPEATIPSTKGVL